MKYTGLILSVLWLAIACTGEETQENLTVGEKIAKAHGFDSFNKISMMEYTFNVQRDTLFFNRSWEWNINSGEIVYSRNDERVVFNQKEDKVDEIKTVDQRFINDKYWLLFPYHLVWDSDVSYVQEADKPAPISGKNMHHVVVSYAANGGYTPGDVYELYCDDDWIIREWVFRRGGEPEPTITCTWEGYEDLKGLKIATDHKNADGSFRLYFTNLKVE